MLNKELSHFAEHNKSDNQIAEFICNTYLDKKGDEIEMPTIKINELIQSKTIVQITNSDGDLILGEHSSKALCNNIKETPIDNNNDNFTKYQINDFNNNKEVILILFYSIDLFDFFLNHIYQIVFS